MNNTMQAAQNMSGPHFQYGPRVVHVWSGTMVVNGVDITLHKG